jgi:hypothetical protein
MFFIEVWENLLGYSITLDWCDAMDMQWKEKFD